MNIFNNLINGEWVPSPHTSKNINPSDITDIVGEYAQADVEQVNTAVAAAKAAQPGWGASTPQQRFDVLDFIGAEILARKDELGRLLSREEGKTLPEGIGEVVRAGNIFKFFAAEALRVGGEHIPSVRPGIEIDTMREPLGVVGLITPWNFPMAIPSWKVAPALAFGNAVLLKPAELAPACSWNLAEIISRSGLPKGVFNLVMGKGSAVGNTIVNHPDVAGVSFTGSVEVGRTLASNLARRLARVQLEMGGKNPLVVLDDADLTVAVNAAINGAFFSTGQRCTASSRLIVTEGIHDRFVQAMVEKMKTLKVDDALAPGTDIGPVIDGAQLMKDESYIELARREGGKLAFGGQRLKREKNGWYLAPALFTETTNSMRFNCEEAFGPLAGVIRVKNYDEALAVANDTEFGLCAGICTTSLKHSTHFKRNAQAGMVMVNLPTAGVDYHVPFGGRKGSSYGTREQGSYAKEFYTVVKTCYVAG
ncbi:MAG: aldehyde dehydrogenase family protein [Bacteroidetes bacterium]|nr:aldehyde dehydrogenase family protein [Bacteroidota bacterium]MCW5895435.1 aldehyde dehydrogenase family protein [Bacteroidota bacterium]